MLYFYMFIAVQIVLESFPVSSSSHLFLLERYLQKCGYEINHCHGFFFDFLHFDFVNIDVLEHFLHGITLIIIVCFFFSRWFYCVIRLSSCWRIIIKLICLTAIADGVTAVLYFLFNTHVIVAKHVPLGLGLLITAIALFSLRWCSDTFFSRFDWRKALALGFVQGVALLPGVSRLALTYATGRWLSLSGRRAFEVSLLIHCPLMLVAFLNSVRMLSAQTNVCFLCSWGTMIVMLVSGVIAFYGLRFVAYAVEKNRVWLFSFYMIIPFLVWLLLL